jgi:hypothetical protein
MGLKLFRKSAKARGWGDQALPFAGKSGLGLAKAAGDAWRKRSGHVRRADAELVDRRALDAARAGDAARVEALLEPVHPADVADLLEQVSETDREALLAMGSAVIDGEVLSEISDAIREEVLDALPDDVVAEALRELDSDDLVDIVEDLEAEDQGRLSGRDGCGRPGGGGAGAGLAGAFRRASDAARAGGGAGALDGGRSD